MKLGNFYNKDSPSKRQATQTKFTLSNGRLELELKEEQTKNLELQTQCTEFLNELGELKGKINILTANSSSITHDFEEATQTLQLKESSYKDAQQKIEGIPALETHIRGLKANNDNLNSIIETAQRNSMHQGADLERATQERDAFRNEITQNSAESEQRRKDVLSFQAKAAEFKEKFEGIQTVMNDLKGKYKETQRSRNTLYEQATYFEGKATELYERVQAIEEVDIKLRQWLEDLQTDSTEVQSASKHIRQKNVKLMALISDMGKTLGDLTLDRDYLSQMNSVLKKELAKPKFMSMGAIARKEGFKMPTNKESITMQSLGNTAPTLLKFKAKEENNAR